MGVRFTQRLAELMAGELSTEQLSTGQTLHTLSLLTAASQARLVQKVQPDVQDGQPEALPIAA